MHEAAAELVSDKHAFLSVKAGHQADNLSLAPRLGLIVSSQYASLFHVQVLKDARQTVNVRDAIAKEACAMLKVGPHPNVVPLQGMIVKKIDAPPLGICMPLQRGGDLYSYSA